MNTAVKINVVNLQSTAMDILVVMLVIHRHLVVNSVNAVNHGVTVQWMQIVVNTIKVRNGVVTTQDS